MKTKWILGLAIVLMSVVVGGAAFLGVRTLIRSDSYEVAAQVDDSTRREPGWWLPFYNEDAKKPQFDQEINGILVGPGVKNGGPEACQPGEARGVDIDMAAGTVLDVTPGYLPEGATYLLGRAVACGETVVYTEREYHVPYVASEDPDVPLQTGGTIKIRRSLRPNDRLQLFGAAERFSGATIAGSDAVIVMPVMPDGVDVGFFSGVIVIKEAVGFTVLQGGGLPWAEIIRIAENLRRG